MFSKAEIKGSGGYVIAEMFAVFVCFSFGLERFGKGYTWRTR
jgi:hypothetical protein